MQTSIAESALEIAKNNKALRDALYEAQESERIRSNFIANLNHELITPMTGVLGMIDLLADTPLDKDQTEYVTLAKDSGQRFLTTVNSIVNLSNIENDRFVITDKLFNLDDCLAEISTNYTVKTETLAPKFKLSIPDNLPTWVYGDMKCLQQAISILLDNAIKFTSTGCISFNAFIQAINHKEALIKFEVNDTVCWST